MPPAADSFDSGCDIILGHIDFGGPSGGIFHQSPEFGNVRLRNGLEDDAGAVADENQFSAGFSLIDNTVQCMII